MLYYKFQSKLRGLFLLIIFSTFLFTSNIVAQQSKLVENIDIQGNRRLTDQELLRHIKTRVGEQFNEKKMQNDLESLLKLGFFNELETRVFTEVGRRGGVNVIFEVMELPLIVEINFNGLRYVTDKEIQAELQEQKIEIGIGTPYDLVKIKKARQRIIEYFNKRGFVDAKVEVIEEDVTATTLKVSFMIDELPNDDDN
jgi:outer membrane protein insertion porin family